MFSNVSIVPNVCMSVNRDIIINMSHVPKNAAMYTQGHDFMWMESANQMTFPTKNNAHGVIAVDAACGLIIVSVASNKQMLPVHFSASHWNVVILIWMERSIGMVRETTHCSMSGVG